MIERKSIEKIKTLLPLYLREKHNIDNLNQKFTCLNPNHEDRHPSMSYTPKYNICKCFSCGIKYDIFDLIELDYGITSFKEKIEIIKQIFPNMSDTLSKNIITTETKNEVINFTNYFKKCMSKIDKTNYLNERKINKELIKKYNIGYDDKIKMIIFPINANCYFARSVLKNGKKKSRGTSYLWNEELIKNSNQETLIYVTESIIDSLSLETIDPNVKTVALNGLSNYKRLLNVAKEQDFKGTFVLVFDNDQVGKMYQDIVKEELRNININSFSTTLISNLDTKECKDLNEALINYKDVLLENYNYFNENYKMIISNKIKENQEDIEL